MRDYAITGDIKLAFTDALRMVDESLKQKGSSGAYIHGSFGSGKSHFMAVLSLMLGGDPTPWKEPILHDLLARYDWLTTRKFLRLHFHMLGSDTLDQKVFSEYLAQVRAIHPDAVIPPLFRDESLFENAQRLRQDMGDEKFFAKLNAGAKASGWGKFAGGAGSWTGAKFDEARASSEAALREQLFNAIVKTVFPAFAEQDRGFVDFDSSPRCSSTTWRTSRSGRWSRRVTCSISSPAAKSRWTARCASSSRSRNVSTKTRSFRSCGARIRPTRRRSVSGFATIIRSRSVARTAARRDAEPTTDS
jgi:hypothetical protein